ncbi:MAG: hypothetical protein ACHQ9S_13370 [Candidatus Binatia bacterium]
MGVLCFFVYLTNLRQIGAWDSIPARLLPFSVLRQGNLDLDEFTWLRRLIPNPYFLRRLPSGHWVSAYPIGVPVMMTPLYLPVTWWLDHHHIDDDDVRFRLASVVMERVAAALITAASVGLVFLAAAATATQAVAVVLALIYGLGTSTWAISSQALWQHGPAELGLAGLCLFLIAPNTRRNAMAAGGFAALGVLARPTMMLFALVALVFVWRERRSQLMPFLSLPVVGAGLLLAYNLRLVSIVTGGYQVKAFALPNLGHLVGLLFSPNRGLFTYTPFAALAVPVMLRPKRDGPRWLAYAPIGVAGYLLLYSSWSGWWGGHCYGPRFLTDLLPVLVLCATQTVERLCRSRGGRMLVAALALWGFVVQAIGVYDDDNSWNALPESVDVAPWRAWDWTDLQVLRAARAGWRGFDLAPLLWQTAVRPEPALLRPIDGTDLVGEITSESQLPLRYRGGSAGTLDLRISNLSGVTWPAFSDYGFLQVWILYRWWFGGVVVDGEGGFVMLPRNLGPRESASVRARIDPPTQRGSYQLELMVVQPLDPTKGTPGAALRMPAEIE